MEYYNHDHTLDNPTVQDLIDALNQIKDKTKPIAIGNSILREEEKNYEKINIDDCSYQKFVIIWDLL